MTQFFKKMFKAAGVKKRLANSGGQIAIVLILVIAVALVFYAVTLNIGDFATSQTIVTVASNTSAAMLASDMASYGQSLSSTSLKGERKICAWTGIMAAIITIIVIVIVIVISIYTSGSAAAFFAKGGALLIAGLILATVALVIQVVVIQPGITEAWNRITSKTLSMTNQFTEGAIQNALGKAVTDQMLVPDISDNDGDRLWVPATAIGTLPYADTISRYSMYYTERLRAIKEIPNIAAVSAFIDALEEFLYRGTDDWAIHDPVLAANCRGRAECHACCVPWSATVGGEAVDGLRSEECENYEGAAGDAFWEPKCYEASPYQSPGGTSSYPWLFDIYWENPDNTFYSFRELLGRDDEHQDFYKDPNDPNSDPSGIPGPGRPSQFFHASGSSPLFTGGTGSTATGFRLEDTTGFYVPPFYPYGIERRKGIFPFFYKMDEWGVNLNDAVSQFGVPEARECHWCDPNIHPGCNVCTGKPPHEQPREIQQLLLPLDPSDPANNIIHNLTGYVDGFPGRMAVDRIDNYVLAPRYWDIIGDDNVCAQRSLYPSVTVNGFWKPGGDRFCKNTAAYHLDCPKGATCPGSGATRWPDDVLDDIIYGSAEFIAWAQQMLAMGSDTKRLSRDFILWYEEAAAWIEPRSGTCFYCGSLTLPDGTSIPEGILHIWNKEMTRMRDRLQAWITNDNRGYLGNNCSDVWCLPVRANCPGFVAGEGEETTFDANNNGVRGDIEDIVKCIRFNSAGWDHIAADRYASGGARPTHHLDGTTEIDYAPNTSFAVKPTTVPEGNDVRFERCATTCSVGECNRLPRSIVPGFDTTAFQGYEYDPGAMGTVPLSNAMANARFLDMTAFNDCLRHCSPKNCEVGARLPTVQRGTGIPYSYPPGGTPLDCLTNWGTYLAGNPWYDDIMTNLLAIQSPDHEGIVRMASCAYDCSSNIADCGLMPEYIESTIDPLLYDPGDMTTWGTPYVWPDIDADGIPNLPSEFTVLDHCDPVTKRPLPPWDTAIATNIQISGGPSCDTLPGGWLDSVRQSSFEAINQVAKFDKRWRFFEKAIDYNSDNELDFTIGRLAEAKEVIALLDNAITQFTDFLTGPAQNLIQARINYDPDVDTGLPYQAIYGWRDPEDPKAPGVRGKWHIVKVEARVPDMCDDRCSENQTSPDPSWPKIKTYTKNWGTKRCYELVNTEGSVKFRTTRWDEDKSIKPCAGESPCPDDCGSCGFGSTDTYRITLKFPTGQPLWIFRGNNPLRPVDRAVTNPDLLDNYCDSSEILTIPGTYTTTAIYEGAFIMNRFFPQGDPDDNHLCWNLANMLLSHGYMNETCAEYYWHGGTNEGMGIEFVPCKDF